MHEQPLSVSNTNAPHKTLSLSNSPPSLHPLLLLHQPDNSCDLPPFSSLPPPSGNLGSVMVSLRRRRNLGLESGMGPVLDLPEFSDHGPAPQTPPQNSKSCVVTPMPTVPAEGAVKVSPGSGSSEISVNSSSKDKFETPDREVTRKKRPRKLFENQEPSAMRGVYLKNSKWQAAIKVDKKQIHLGTVGSQEEAAHLYDRAAFMCGREPNFELREEEKQELRQLKWEEFLAVTRYSITNKKNRGRVGVEPQKQYELPVQNSEWEGDQEVNGFSASEDIERVASA